MADAITSSRTRKPADTRKAADTRSDTRQAAKTAKASKGWEPPYDGFPLSYHPPSGRLYKKIRGKRFYFGTADKWEIALNKFQQQRDDLFAGRTPRPATGEGGISVALLADTFLNAKRRLLEAGELAARTFGEHHGTCGRVVEFFGRTTPVSALLPDDFGRLRAELAKTRAAVTLGNEVQRVRSLFKFGFDEGLISTPIRFGQSFNKPSKKTLRLARAAAPAKMFEPAEVRAILADLESKPTLRAAVLLALNAAYGSADISSLPVAAVDFENGFVTFPRPKTGVARRAKLWCETSFALREVLANRPQPADPADKDLFFLTANGKRWLRAVEGDDPAKWTWRTDSLGKEFVKVMRKLKLSGGRGLYSLRHVHQTVAESCGDFVAIRHVMGHADASMSAAYRERIDDSRLEVVAETVHRWLWPDA